MRVSRGAVEASAVFAASFVIYLVTGGFSLQSADTDAASVPAWVMVRTGSVDLNTAISLLDSTVLENPWFVAEGDGLYSNRFPGVIAYGLPFYAGANVLGFDSLWVPGIVAASAATAGAVALMLVVLRDLGLNQRSRLFATGFFGFGTATWSVSADAQWPHGIDQLLITLALLSVSRNRAGSAGLVFGLTVLARPQLAPAVLCMGVLLAVSERSPRLLVRFGLPALAGAGLLVAYNGTVFGRWSFDNGASAFSDSGFGEVADLPVNLLGTLVDPSRGVLILYPALLVVALGIAAAWEEAPGWARVSAISGAVAIVTQLALNRYSGGDTFFGSRNTIEALTLAYPVLVLSWHKAPRAGRQVGVPLLVLSVALHAIGAVGFPYVAAGQLPAGPTYAAAALVAVTVCTLLWILWPAGQSRDDRILVDEPGAAE